MPPKDVGFYSPQLAKRIRDNSFAWERERGAKPVDLRMSVPNPVYVLNGSQYEIPAYGCMQITGVESIDGETYLKVDRPFDYTDSVMGPFLLNVGEAIPIGNIGMAQPGPIYRAKTGGTTLATGTRIGPTANSFEVSKGCLFTCCGNDDIEDDVIRVIACETPLIAVAGSGGIAANGSGTVTAKVPTSTGWAAGSVTYTAFNISATAISNNANVLIFPVDARWVAVEVC